MTTETKTENRGGRRAGSGRKPFATKQKKFTFQLPEILMDEVKGNKAKFMREAIQAKLDAERLLWHLHAEEQTRQRQAEGTNGAGAF